VALIKDRTTAKNRGQNLINPLLSKHNSDRLRQIECQMKAVDEAIMALIDKDATLKARFDILVSIPGVSRITALMSRQSRRSTGRAFIAGGRAIVRQALYMSPSSQAVSTQTSRLNTISSKPPEKHQRSPSQPSCYVANGDQFPHTPVPRQTNCCTSDVAPTGPSITPALL
jgi:hypothetical protein